ncbi:MAG: CoA transferase [Woeseia sp.]|nr:CoA transferase [Woeseia sp.]
MNGAALEGVKVIDLTRVLAGPWASQLLADYGANVIKIEHPLRGDDTRGWGPPWLQDEGGKETTDSAYYLAANRNKRSIAIDLSRPEGAELVKALVVNADVLMENFRVGTMRRFGLEYSELKRVNPALIFCSISAYGQDSSRSDEPGYDAMMQASGGLMSITGEEDTGPQKVGVAVSDIMSGMYAATGILTALVSRGLTGVGQHVDIPLYDAQVGWLANQNMNYLIGNENPGRLGTSHPNLVPYQAFSTSDGHLVLAVGTDRQFMVLMRTLGLDECAEDPRFMTNADRVENRELLVPKLVKVFKQKSTADWLQKLTAKGVPAGPINTIAQVFSDSYAKERKLVRMVKHRDAGVIPTVANPVRFSHTPVSYRNAPPVLGEHTVEVLTKELGLTDQATQQLIDSGVVKATQ